MPPSEVSEILISYFSETTRAILEKDGMITKYMGDAEAEESFRKVSEQRGIQDGPSGFYLKEIARLRASPQSDVPWDGIIRFESK